MNSKAIKRQLLAAIAMVLVAALALGSSTYAWFVASGTVTATGMSVQAQAEGNLVIRYKLDTWGTTATATPDSTVSLLPASTDNLKNWVYSKAATSGAYSSDGTYTNLVDNGSVVVDMDNNGSATTSKYVMIRKFQVRSATADIADAAKGLFVSKVTATYSDALKDLSSALRVGVRCGDTSLIFGPVGSPAYGSLTTENKKGVHVFEGDDVVEKEVELAQTGNAGTSPNNTLFSGTITNDKENALNVYIYVWYEGEDTSLYSDNYAAQGLNVSVELTSISTINPDYTASTAQKVDLSSGTTISSNATQAKSSADAESTTNYYAITGKMSTEGNQLYTDEASKSGLTSTSNIYTISGSGDNAVAKAYTNVTLPNA